MRLASATTIFSGLRTRRTVEVSGSASSTRTRSRFRYSRSTAPNTASEAIGGRLPSRPSSGRATVAIRREDGNSRSMYQPRASGSDSSRSVSAVGAQSTTSRS